jgi:hypothetical protein
MLLHPGIPSMKMRMLLCGIALCAWLLTPLKAERRFAPAPAPAADAATEQQQQQQAQQRIQQWVLFESIADEESRMQHKPRRLADEDGGLDVEEKEAGADGERDGDGAGEAAESREGALTDEALLDSMDVYNDRIIVDMLLQGGMDPTAQGLELRREVHAFLLARFPQLYVASFEYRYDGEGSDGGSGGVSTYAPDAPVSTSAPDWTTKPPAPSYVPMTATDPMVTFTDKPTPAPLSVSVPAEDAPLPAGAPMPPPLDESGDAYYNSIYTPQYKMVVTFLPWQIDLSSVVIRGVRFRYGTAAGEGEGDGIEQSKWDIMDDSQDCNRVPYDGDKDGAVNDGGAFSPGFPGTGILVDPAPPFEGPSEGRGLLAVPADAAATELRLVIRLPSGIQLTQAEPMEVDADDTAPFSSAAALETLRAALEGSVAAGAMWRAWLASLEPATSVQTVTVSAKEGSLAVPMYAYDAVGDGRGSGGGEEATPPTGGHKRGTGEREDAAEAGTRIGIGAGVGALACCVLAVGFFVRHRMARNRARQAQRQQHAVMGLDCVPVAVVVAAPPPLQTVPLPPSPAFPAPSAPALYPSAHA